MKDLAKQYKIQGYPTILRDGCRGQSRCEDRLSAGRPGEVREASYEVRRVHDDVVKLTGELPNAKGLDRAKLLDKLIDDYIALDNEIDDIPAWDKEIVKLDADNKAGLKVKHEFRILMAEFDALKESQKVTEAKAVADKMLALPGISSQQQLDVYLGPCAGLPGRQAVCRSQRGR